jgi:DNA-binding XRE family transcriptional regulator
MPSIDELLVRVEMMRRLPTPEERKRIRVAAGLTRDEVGSVLGVTSTAIYQWETGKADPGKASIGPYVELLERLNKKEGA